MYKGDIMKLNKYIDWLIRMIGYALVLIGVSIIFNNTVYIDNSYFGFWGLVSVVIIFILNKTIKPVVVWLTLPLTAITLGLFYLVINVLILKITDFILMSHFDINGIIMPCIVSLVLSVMNTIMDKVITNNIIKVKNR
jgi:putative membrane protein